MCGSVGRRECDREWLGGLVTTLSPAHVVKGAGKNPMAVGPS
jgi:hypothetical protein